MTKRTAAQIREHYEIEKALADRLRRATREERQGLYGVVYDELYRRVTDHSYHERKASAAETRTAVRNHMKLLGPFLRPDVSFLEFGAGDCSLALEVAAHVKQVTAVEVSDTIAVGVNPPSNFRLLLADALDAAVEPGSQDVVYSNDFIEHLHPDDALQQLRLAASVLKPGGVCICRTPNRAAGPWDISGSFDAVATGLHLKEYTVLELDALFRAAGLTRTRAAVVLDGRLFLLPLWPTRWCERLFGLLPRRLARRLGTRSPFLEILGVNLVGVK